MRCWITKRVALFENRRHVYAVLTAIWFVILPFQSHNVLLGEQAGEPLGNTLAYFGMNDVILAAGLGIATFVHGRRRRTPTAPLTHAQHPAG